MPSASESFDTYLAKKHPTQHCSIKHKQHHHHEKHQCSQCKHLKRASQSLDNEFSNNKHGGRCDAVGKRQQCRHFSIGDVVDDSVDVEEPDKGDNDDGTNAKPNSSTRGAQSWRALRAVVAYYCSLRKIKREAIINT